MTTGLAPNNLGPPFPGPSGDSALHPRYRTRGRPPQRNTQKWGSTIRPGPEGPAPDRATVRRRAPPRRTAPALRRAAGVLRRRRAVGGLLRRGAPAVGHLHARDDEP